MNFPKSFHMADCNRDGCEYVEYEWRNMQLCVAKAKSNLKMTEQGVDNRPESPNHYSRLKALTGVETWDILDFVAGNDPDMWNLGKYWFRMGHKEGQSTLIEKKKMLKYLERSIEKEESSTE